MENISTASHLPQYQNAVALDIFLELSAHQIQIKTVKPQPSRTATEQQQYFTGLTLRSFINVTVNYKFISIV